MKKDEKRIKENAEKERRFIAFKRQRFFSKIDVRGKASIFSPLFLFAVSLILLTIACQPNSRILNSSRSTPAPVEKPQDNFESAMRGIESADFSYIIILRRKDGGKFDAEDKRFVKANTPSVTNQFVLTDEEHTIIAGSNFPFPPENLAALNERFAVEDRSKPPAENAETNTNN